MYVIYVCIYVYINWSPVPTLLKPYRRAWQHAYNNKMTEHLNDRYVSDFD